MEWEQVKDPGVDGSIILIWILEKQTWMARTRLIWLRIGTGDGRM
jgi:hypothetical protein